MATERLIIYGALKDKVGVAFAAMTIPLARVKDRISDIVTSHVREEDRFEASSSNSTTTRRSSSRRSTCLHRSGCLT
jgi:hypothetical protein